MAMHVYTTVIVLLSCHACISQRRPLGSYNVDTSSISVSGVSSGGGMSTQFHIAYSSSIIGAGIFAGVPYGCIEIGDPCDSNQIVDFIREAASEGRIDNSSNISGQNVYVFQGVQDNLSDEDSGTKIRNYYKTLGATVAANLSSNAGHGMPTYSYGQECSGNDFPYINKCGWQGAFYTLNHTYKDIKQPSEDYPLNGQMYEYNQEEFTSDMTNHSMDPGGYVYVPSACFNSTQLKCRLHVIFHGCTQSKDTIGDKFVNETEYREVGELNNIIMLYPQSAPNEAVVNPAGCWDVLGFTGSDYLFKTGKQMVAVKRMIDRVTGQSQ